MEVDTPYTSIDQNSVKRGFQPERLAQGLEVGSIRRIQGLDTAYWGFLRVGTTFDIFQNIHILYLEYGVLNLSGYGVLSFIPLWSLRDIWEEEYWGSCLHERCVEISERLSQRNELIEEIRSLKNRLLAVEAIAYYREILAQETYKLERFRTLEAQSYTLGCFREYRNGDILFRKRLFPEKIGYDVKIIDVLALIKDEEKFSKLVSVVDDVFLRMVDNLDSWNSFPWGENIWRQLYDAIRNVSSKHKLKHLDGLRKNHNYVPSYSLSGFLFAFKIWIIEYSCESKLLGYQIITTLHEMLRI
ncbi:hypothetical protein Tco_0494032 [Tanacetum coccineum]